MKWGLWILFFLNVAHAGHGVLNQNFLNMQGEPARISQYLTEPRKPILVLFWANWCLPCKGELKEISQDSELKSRYSLVAVNVDDNSAWQRAQAYLNEIGWKDLALRDEGGTYFYTFQKSGQLPYSMLLDGHGDFLESFFALDLKALHTRSFDSSSKSSPYSVFGGAYFRQLKDDATNDPTAFANFLGVSWSKDSWEASASHQLLYQYNSLLKEKSWEDQLGPSFLQWHSESTRVRLGDDFVSWQGGELLFVQESGNTTDPASLTGVHLNHQQGAFSFQALGGQIKTPLFIREMDPAKDVSVTLPQEQVGGAQAFVGSESHAPLNWKVSGALVRYQRASSPGLGYLQELKDDRFGGSAFVESSLGGSWLRYSEYSFYGPAADGKVKRPHQWDAQAWVLAPSLRVPIYFLESHDVANRVLIPTLLEDPATPLDGKRKTQWKIQPRWEGALVIEPSFTQEKITDLSSLGSQDTSALSIVDEARGVKGQIAYQNTDLQAAQLKSTELGALVSFPLNSFLSLQSRFKTHFGSASGNTQSHVLGIAIKEWLLFNVQGTSQSDYYKGVSGVNRNELYSAELVFNAKSWNARWAVGSAPGGTVCANGVCTQKVALNGTQADINYHIDF